MKTYFLIAGEASGDLHAARLIEAIKRREPDARFVGLGGDKMRNAGCRLVQDYREMAFMGVVAVLKNLGKVKRNFEIAKTSILTEKPDVLILIDYPSFNLKMAEFARTRLPGIKIVYYIPPGPGRLLESIRLPNFVTRCWEYSRWKRHFLHATGITAATSAIPRWTVWVSGLRVIRKVHGTNI